ncbi:Nucleolar_protein NOP2 [Hexamita inflata]|uniref:Nucleolar protein NOP2 n=1 Tax=Hexamita inflata TaxID=28002 RepID=A0AA86U5G6_9EUKA|nr:Nucleolar protein NOP2 [Hexamita inflata]CAI9931093.1 Nucleolar protein NOP2 [Hexamita inflata]CAI9941246.1 Nucleolar protein NOP2 [Hexamita inflata]
MSLFARSAKAKIVDEAPAKIQLDLSSDSSEELDELQNLQNQEEQHEAEAKEDQAEPQADQTTYDPRTDTAETPEQMKQRIARVQYVLSNFNAQRNKNISRVSYIEILKHDVCELYGYAPETAEILLGLFGPEEFVQFVQSCEQPRPVTIRVNTLRLKRKELAALLVPKGVELEPISWCHEALTVFKSQVPIGATPEYLRGYYMPQDAASLLPVLALKPKENEKILDMAAAPGGKSTHICQLMKNSGVLICNDASEKRILGLQSNLSRMGCTNAIVVNYDGQDIPFNNFDRILLDAPCTGLGVISKDQRVKTSRDNNDLRRMQEIQRRLLWKALDILNADPKAPRLVCYSTCSVSVAENEAVVDYVIRERGDCQIVDMGLDIGKPGFKNFKGTQFVHGIDKARRFYPHIHNVQGFFVCLIQKKPGMKCKREYGKASE